MKVLFFLSVSPSVCCFGTEEDRLQVILGMNGKNSYCHSGIRSLAFMRIRLNENCGNNLHQLSLRYVQSESSENNGKTLECMEDNGGVKAGKRIEACGWSRGTQAWDKYSNALRFSVFVVRKCT